MTIEVHSTGPSDADLYLVGEAPGREEVIGGKPFVGPAGRLLDTQLAASAIARVECRIGNLSPVRAPGDKYARLDAETRSAGLAAIKADILATNPNVVVALGNEPLQALCGKTGIQQWRGSLLWNTELGCKVVPTIHPSFFQHAGQSEFSSWYALSIFDLKRALKESESPEWHPGVTTLMLGPSFETVCKELKRLRGSDMVAFDIETNREYPLRLTAISFADSAEWAICIPFTKMSGERYWSAEREERVMVLIKELLEDESIKKIAQNAPFDMGVLQQFYDIRVANLWLDSMISFHTCYPELPKSLAVLCSIYSRQPYYKHLVKGGDLGFWRYNALDSCVAYEVALGVVEDMRDLGVEDFYREHEHPLIEPFLEIQLRGVKVDERAFYRFRGKLQAELGELQAEIDELTYEFRAKRAWMEYRQGASALIKSVPPDYSRKRLRNRVRARKRRRDKALGEPMNVASPKQLAELLYEDMKLPRQRSRKTSSTTTEAVVLRKLQRKKPSRILEVILAIKPKQKLLGTYLAPSLIRDGRMHTSYNIGGRVADMDTGRVVAAPETGRRSSSRSIVMQSGTNLQNIPHGDCRRCFVPDEGYVFLGVDLKYAELYIRAYRAGDEEIIATLLRGEDPYEKLIEALPKGWMPEGTEYTNSKNPRRLFMKKHTHALDYGEGVYTLAERAAIPVVEARQLRKEYFEKRPRIAEWQERVGREVHRTRVQVNPFGRRRQFFGRSGDQLKRDALANDPQGTVSDVLDMAFLRTYRAIKQQMLDAQLMLHEHDGFTLQCRPYDVSAIQDIFKGAFDIRFEVGGRELTIPYEVTVGKNWQDAIEVDEWMKQSVAQAVAK